MGIRGDNLNGLPTELICNIFRLAINPITAREDIIKLSLVCRQWREYVEGSALLWTNISAWDGRIHMRRALEKSKGALIDLRCPVGVASELYLEEFLKEAAPHIARWHSLTGEVESPSSVEDVLGPLTTALAPCLESLDLSVYDHPYSQDAITLFGEAPAPPTLKNLNLYRMPLAFEPLRPSGLVSLGLKKVESISTPQLLEILRGSPRLETLTLAENPRLVAIGSQPSTIHPIELPKLVFLSFEQTDHGGTNSIISNIRIPNRHRLYIHSDIDGAGVWSTLFTPTIRHILHPTIPAPNFPPSVIRLEIRGDNKCTIRFRGVVLALLMDGEDRVLRTLGWLADGLGSEAAGCPVYLILDRSEMDPVRITAVPSPLEVKHVSISDYWSVCWKINCTAMARPPDATTPEWLFPQVESLSIGLYNTKSQTQLISMLRNRYNRESPGEETGFRCPMSLRSVELRCQPKTEGLVEEIRSILGGANVFWVDN